MRVAFYTSTILEHSGGLEKFFIEVASSLSERFDELDIDIITNSDRFAERLQGVLSVYYLKRLEVSNVYKESPSQIRARLGNKVNYIKATSMRQLRLLLQRYDVVYSKNELIEVIIFRLLGYRHLPPVIFGCHTTLYYPNARSFHTRLHNILYTGKVYRILTKSARAFHVLNYTDYRILCEGEVDCVLIPNPFNFDGFRSEFCSEGDSALAVDPDRFNVVWAGRLTEQKGIDRLISIIYQCQDEEWGGNIVWNIFGDGERREDVERLTREVRGVRYFGHVEEARLVGFMAMCQVLVSTSLWESFGYSIMQGIGANIPVISFDIPGPNEIICDGGNGFLVADVGQFIEKLQFLILGGGVVEPGSGLERFTPNQIYPMLRTMLYNAAGDTCG